MWRFDVSTCEKYNKPGQINIDASEPKNRCKKKSSACVYEQINMHLLRSQLSD